MASNKLYTLLFVVATFLLWGCGNDSNSFKIKGKFTGMKAGELYLFSPYGNVTDIDTVKLSEGEFEYGGKVDNAAPFVLLFPNGMEQVIFVSPGTKTEYEAAANDLMNYSVKGTVENDLMTQFRQDIHGQKGDKIKAAATKFIKQHAESEVAVFIFDKYFLQSKKSSYKETKKLFDILKKAQPENNSLLTLEQSVGNIRNLTVGDKLPDVEITPRNNKKYKLWSREAEHTLVVVWSTWIRNEYDYMWKLRKLTDDRNKKKLRIVTFSVDNRSMRWNDMTRQDSLTIEHSYDGKSWNSPDIKKLCISSVPHYFLVDKTHKIIEEGDNVDQMVKDVEKHVKVTPSEKKEK